jgi:hypothetical protein
LGEYIRTHGAPNKLFSDNAKAQQSAKVKEILQNFAVDDASSEPHYQNQNAAERKIQDVKKDMEMVMNLTHKHTIRMVAFVCGVHCIGQESHGLFQPQKQDPDRGQNWANS